MTICLDSCVQSCECRFWTLQQRLYLLFCTHSCNGLQGEIKTERAIWHSFNEQGRCATQVIFYLGSVPPFCFLHFLQVTFKGNVPDTDDKLSGTLEGMPTSCFIKIIGYMVCELLELLLPILLYYHSSGLHLGNAPSNPPYTIESAFDSLEIETVQDTCGIVALVNACL